MKLPHSRLGTIFQRSERLGFDVHQSGMGPSQAQTAIARE